MRELERTDPDILRDRSIALIGPGRVGHALSAALSAAGLRVSGPLGRGETAHADIVLLCVPDAEIAAAAARCEGQLVGHTSGATPLAALAAAEAFGLHPLQTVSGRETGFEGCACAIAGSTGRSLAVARQLAEAAGMRPFEIDDADRAAYHAAASVASNFLVTLMDAGEQLAQAAGLSPARARAALQPLVRTTIENWAVLGPERALTGPIARGDEATVARQREAVASAAAELLPLFDALADRTRALARREAVPA